MKKKTECVSWPDYQTLSDMMEYSYSKNANVSLNVKKAFKKLLMSNFNSEFKVNWNMLLAQIYMLSFIFIHQRQNI